MALLGISTFFSITKYLAVCPRLLAWQHSGWQWQWTHGTRWSWVVSLFVGNWISSGCLFGLLLADGSKVRIYGVSASMGPLLEQQGQGWISLVYWQSLRLTIQRAQLLDFMDQLLGSVIDNTVGPVVGSTSMNFQALNFTAYKTVGSCVWPKVGNSIYMVACGLTVALVVHPCPW